MHIEELLPGLLLIKPRVFEDHRGHFFESFRSDVLQKHGVNDAFVQDNQSLSNRGILRGLHFQLPPHTQSKLVRVVQGAVLDVAVDIRKGSPTYGEHVAVELSAENHHQLYIPEGFAHGFLTLQDRTLFLYKCNRYYAPDFEQGLPWNDPDLNVNWGIENPVLSAKDEAHGSFAHFQSPFTYPSA
jgi:dTDP-4-dehydrorhamnose 3,5-epimerase